MDMLYVNEPIAIQILQVAGVLDFVLAVLIFIPGKAARWALAYAVLWGLATSVARVWANVYWEFPLESLHQWLFESVMRLPHALIPLALWLWLGKERETGK